MEEWKIIPNYECYYEASNTGKVRNLVTKLILKQDISRNYPKVCLSKENKKKTLTIHRLIATTFLKKDIENLTVNHKDGNKLNNNVKNLECITLSENINHAFENGLRLQKKTKIINKKTLEEAIFKNQISASKFIKKNKNYIAMQLIRKNKENKDYKWEVCTNAKV